MRRIILTPREAAIRAADEQVSVMMVMYGEKPLSETTGLEPAFIETRLQILRRLQTTLHYALAGNDLLPRAAEPEKPEPGYLLELLRDLVTDNPFELPLAEETKLLMACEEILEQDPALFERIRAEYETTRIAIGKLQRSRMSGAQAR